MYDSLSFKYLNLVSVKNKIHTSLLVLTTLLLVIFACSKSKITQEPKSIPFPNEIELNNCLLGPDYGTKVICPSWRGPHNDHKVKPKNDPGPGLYFAWPTGLLIDANTGEINVTQSETGAKYIIGFIPA